MYSKDNYTDEDRKALCESCEEECRFNKKEDSVNNGLDLGCGVIWKDKESMNEDLDDYAKEILSWEDLHEDWDRLVIRKTAKHFTDWQKEQMTKTAIDGKIYETQARSKLKAATIGKISGLKYRVGDKVKLIILKED